MKEICKNCCHAQQSYKCIICEMAGKKTKTTANCDDWRPKNANA